MYRTRLRLYNFHIQNYEVDLVNWNNNEYKYSHVQNWSNVYFALSKLGCTLNMYIIKIL